MKGKSTPNRSLERGLQILRAFRPGTEWLGNGDLAERTQLPRATISRLTQSMVRDGILRHHPARRAYALGAPVLSMAFSMRSSSTLLRHAAPLMESLARRERINVGMAFADDLEMVYLESMRLSRGKSIRTVMPGQRIPMELTSLGRAWLSTRTDAERTSLDHRFAARHPRHWPRIREEITAAIQDVASHGYCAASWLPDVIALACPLQLDDAQTYVLNVSLTSELPRHKLVARLHAPLLELATEIQASWASEMR